ncbi:hypothetical protein [Asticcacaulis sp.]|uniref:hypothetical protein n=1 Tax=Asticcacaulis sp. TaxID=1872648 RepID=UPI002C12EF75|nr:hypothetical protein [Asticcacaulis sp.]HTM81081.1 hypothetical protein [Asticcacaulis sp.]
MPHHHAITNSPDLGRGAAFTIQSGALRCQDILDLLLAEGGKVEATVERFDVTGLTIRQDGAIFKCRPWRMGDAEVRRLSGTFSVWTIDQVLEAAEDDVHA